MCVQECVCECVYRSVYRRVCECVYIELCVCAGGKVVEKLCVAGDNYFNKTFVEVSKLFEVEGHHHSSLFFVPCSSKSFCLFFIGLLLFYFGIDANQ